MADVVLLGEAMLLLVAREPGPLPGVRSFDKATAGAETNVAVGLARLGLDVRWTSRLGDDSLGQYLLATFRAEGIDCSRVMLDPAGRTGLMFKGRVDDGSDPPIEYHRRGSAASQMDADDLDPGWLTAARHLHITGVFPALSDSTLAATRFAIATMREAGRTISFDPNLRPRLWPSSAAMRDTVNALAAGCDWVLPGLEEGRQLTGAHTPQDIAAFYLAEGARQVVVKMGADGAWYDDGQQRGHVPAVPVARVVDTVGAGDGFAVGLVSALLQGRSLPDAVRRGHWIGARAVQVTGDTAGLPTAAELAEAAL